MLSMKRLRPRWRLFLAVLTLALSAVLSGHAEAAELRSFGQNIRALGMGGVRLTTGEDAAVLLWNPAGLRLSEGMRLDIFNLGLGTNGYQNYQTFTQMGTIHGLEDLTPLYGKPLNVGVNGYAAMSFPNMGFAVFDEGWTDIKFNNPAFPELNVAYYNDYGYALGGAFGVGPVSFGVSVKRITRSGGYKTIGAEMLDGFDTSTVTSMFTDEGVGYGLDLGVLLRAPAPFNPTLSIAWQNVGHTEFQLSKGTITPPGIRDNVVLGATIDGDVGLAGFAAGVEYRHVGLPGEQLGKKIHMGAELSLLNLDLRAGFYQGYTTYGVGLDLFLVQLDAALYSAERGAYPGQTPDQRINVGLSASFGFDPDFNLISFGGKGRKLKQRR